MRGASVCRPGSAHVLQCCLPHRTADPRAASAAAPGATDTGGDNGAEDVIQAVWFKARGVDDSQAIDNPRAYLYRLAANLATDHGRESTRRNRLLADHYLWGPDEVISTEEQAMAQDELQRVLDAAGHLPEPTRTIFRLNRLQGLTQAEIARRLGVSVTTVENHVRTALQRLAWARSGR